MSEYIDNMPAAEYHAHPGVGSTTLKTLAKHPPAVYRHRMDHPEHKTAYDLGTVAHSVILEGDWSGVEIIHAKDRRTKAVQEQEKAARWAGKIPLLTHEAVRVWAMYRAVMAHPVARELLTGHVAERSYFAEIDGVPVKARTDALKGSTAIDLKTTSADLGSIERTVASFGYHIQQAHYTDVIEACGQPVDDFVFIFVSTAAPHLVRVIRLEECAVDLGREQARHALGVWKHCTETDTWPGYTGIDTLDLPAWVYAEQEDDIIKEIVI